MTSGAVAAGSVTALILCGGRATRMGGVDKPLQPFQGRPLVSHVLDRIAPQTGGRVLISANRHLDTYAGFGHPVLPDALPDFPGPLAGVLAGLEALSARPGQHWLLCVSGDSPWLPTDLLPRLVAGMAPGQTAAMAIGRDAPDQPLRSQPLASLVHRDHGPALAAALREGERRVERWYRTLPLAMVTFDHPEDGHAFANINDASELARLESPRA